MPTTRRFIISMLSMLFVFSSAFAQGTQTTAVQSGLTITAAEPGLLTIAGVGGQDWGPYETPLIL